jgi:hypothetical protein
MTTIDLWMLFRRTDYYDEARMSQNCGHQRAYCSSPGDMWAWKAMVIIMPAGDNFWLVNQSSLAVPLAETSGRWRENFAHQYLKYFKRSFTCRKILQDGTFGFTSHPKWGVLRILIALKIHLIGRVWTHNPWGSSGKHTNHHNFEATFRGIILVYSENHTKAFNSRCGQNRFTEC